MIADSRGVTGTVAISETPARTLPDRVVTDLGFDLAVVHPGIIIPRGIVSTNVIEAEPVIIVQLEPRFRRTELPAGDAAGMIARPHRGVGLRREYGIEKQAPHRMQYGRRAQGWQGDVSCQHEQGRVAARARAIVSKRKAACLRF